MTISYNWLSEYLPEVLEPAKLSKILTAVGLEVESLEKWESIKGGLEGLVIGQVMEVAQHPNADKLKLTKVNIGAGEPLNIVCGAPNVGLGQKVVVAPIGTTIYPANGEAMTMKVAKIRGEESRGMICAEDEIGLGTSHAGIIVLPDTVVVGTLAAEYIKPYSDYIYEIGLTPNRMDAMSHFGVAKDVCAYLTFHNKKDTRPKVPSINSFKVDNHHIAIKITVENTVACQRYAGVTISGVTVKESPQWIKDKLIAIGQRPINNIVDITNYVLNESGQPLHAFDVAAITGGEVIVKNLPEGSIFVTLDEKERKLSTEDLMICNKEEGMCIAGVFGGAKSGIKETTTDIFLESAWFNPISIRKTSFRHGLRTDAATRFEKGVDISNVVNVLKRAALLIKELAGGTISSDIVDIYPEPKEKTQVAIKYHYLKKLSGKNYHPDAIKKILTSLGFEVLKEGIDELWVSVPFSKPDISLPADIVEEILRIDGLDNVEITGSLTFTPTVDENGAKEALKEKIAQYLVGRGFNEIVTNSITNSKYFSEDVLASTVKMINSLSADLDVMRPSMVETGLEAIAYNLNRKNADVQFFEIGKTYNSDGPNKYSEKEYLSLYLTGKMNDHSWRSKQSAVDFYTAKGIALAVLQLCGIEKTALQPVDDARFGLSLQGLENNHILVQVAEISKKQLQAFDIKQPVYYIDFDWEMLVKLVKEKQITYKEVPRYQSVERDLSIIVDRSLAYEAVEKAVKKTKLTRLKNIRLFDVFESDKLGEGKKSLAVSFTFLNEEKTLTDSETDGMINKIIESFEKELGAEIRK
jgi:phenylalanyl-tRNA synthetase beta chain